MNATSITYNHQAYNQRKHAAAMVKVAQLRQMLAEGKTITEMAQAVGLSERTVLDHLKRIRKEARG